MNQNTEYKLLRYEKNKDKDGNVVSVFIAVLIKENEESLIQEYWLTEDEIEKVLEDENNLISIIEKVVADGIIRLRHEIANKPQPPEIADENKLNEFKIDISNIENEVAKMLKIKENEKNE